MHYKNNDAPDSKKVTLTLTMGQVRFLDKMIGNALGDIEQFGEDEFNKARPLQKLLDVTFPILNIEMTAAEKDAHMDAWIKKYTKDDYERAHGVKV